jgi:hypothetical protein
MNFQTKQDTRVIAVVCVLLVLAMLIAGCAAPAERQVFDTQVVEKLVPVHCKIETPKECRDRYAVDELQVGANPVQENRAIHAELEQRRACELKLRAAVKGCNEQ